MGLPTTVAVAASISVTVLVDTPGMATQTSVPSEEMAVGVPPTVMVLTAVGVPGAAAPATPERAASDAAPTASVAKRVASARIQRIFGPSLTIELSQLAETPKADLRRVEADKTTGLTQNCST